MPLPPTDADVRYGFVMLLKSLRDLVATVTVVAAASLALAPVVVADPGSADPAVAPVATVREMMPVSPDRGRSPGPTRSRRAFLRDTAVAGGVLLSRA